MTVRLKNFYLTFLSYTINVSFKNTQFQIKLLHTIRENKITALTKLYQFKFIKTIENQASTKPNHLSISAEVDDTLVHSLDPCSPHTRVEILIIIDVRGVL